MERFHIAVFTLFLLSGCSGPSKPARDPFNAQFEADVEAIWQRAESIEGMPREKLPWEIAIEYFGVNNNTLLSEYARHLQTSTGQLNAIECKALYEGAYEAMISRCQRKKVLPSQALGECRRGVALFVEQKGLTATGKPWTEADASRIEMLYDRLEQKEAAEKEAKEKENAKREEAHKVRESWGRD